jgi:hypothetical protein
VNDLVAKLRLTRPEAVDAVAIIVLLGVALFGFRSSYGGVEFLVVGLLGAIVGLAVAHAWQRLRPPLLIGVVVAVLVYAVVGGMVALRGRNVLGVVPSIGSVTAAARAAISGWKELVTTNPLVGTTGDLMVLPFFAAYAAAIVAWPLTRSKRLAALALVPVFVVLGLGIITGTNEPVSLVVQGSVLAALSLTWLALRSHRSHQRTIVEHRSPKRAAVGLALLAGATGIGWSLAPHLPMAEASDRTVWRDTVTPPFDPQNYPSPLSGYRHYVKTATVRDAVLFTIEGLPDNVPVRLATMDTYDGLVWRPTYRAELPTTLNSGYFERMGSEIASDFGGDVATIAVTIGAYRDVWVPDVGEVLSLHFEGGPRDRQLNDAFRYNRATDTGASRIALSEGDRYVMKVRLPTLMPALGDAVVSPDTPVGNATPVGAVDKWAATPKILVITQPGGRIDELVDEMRTDGTYSDGDTAQGQIAARAGHSTFRLTEFVDRPSLVGNAEQYASTLALALRTLDTLPSRVVMGFQPGETGGEPVEVTGEQVEAWVEVPVEGVGWVGVFPTPERNQTALKTTAPSQPEPDYQTQLPPAPPAVEAEFDKPATSKSLNQAAPPDVTKDTSDDDDDTAGTVGGSSFPVVPAAVGSVPLVVVLGSIGAIVGIKARRRRRRRSRGTGDERIANGWKEVTDTALDMGRPVPELSTRREASQFIGAATGPLAASADAAIFGPGEPSDEEVRAYWDELERTLRSMKSELSPLDRIKTKLSVTSLRRGKRSRR